MYQHSDTSSASFSPIMSPILSTYVADNPTSRTHSLSGLRHSEMSSITVIDNEDNEIVIDSTDEPTFGPFSLDFNVSKPTDWYLNRKPVQQMRPWPHGPDCKNRWLSCCSRWLCGCLEMYLGSRRREIDSERSDWVIFSIFCLLTLAWLGRCQSPQGEIIE